MAPIMNSLCPSILLSASLLLLLSPACSQSEGNAGSELPGGEELTRDEAPSSDESSTLSEDSGEETLGETGTPSGCYPAGPYRTELGDTIAPLAFVREDGEAHGLELHCGQPPPALILFGTATW